MTTHELANLLLAKADTDVSETLTKRLLEKPNGAKTLNECWCGCGGTTKGKFIPGHDSRFHSLAKKVARGEAEMPEDFVNTDAEADFMKWHDAEVPAFAARQAEKDATKAEKDAVKAEKARLKAEKDAEAADEDEADESVEEAADRLLGSV